jgi:hypothetical protein
MTMDVRKTGAVIADEAFGGYHLSMSRIPYLATGSNQ